MAGAAKRSVLWRRRSRPYGQLYSHPGHGTGQGLYQNSFTPGEVQRDLMGWYRAEQPVPVSNSAKIPALTTGSGLEGNQSILLACLHCKDRGQVHRLSHSCRTGRLCDVFKGEPDTPGWIKCRFSESGSQHSGTNTQHLARQRGSGGSDARLYLPGRWDHSWLWCCSGGSEQEGPWDRRWEDLVLHLGSPHIGIPTQPSVSWTIIHQPAPLLLPVLLPFSVLSLALVYLLCPQVRLGCFDVKLLLWLSAYYLQNSSLDSFYKYYMWLHKTLWWCLLTSAYFIGDHRVCCYSAWPWKEA